MIREATFAPISSSVAASGPSIGFRFGSSNPPATTISETSTTYRKSQHDAERRDTGPTASATLIRLINYAKPCCFIANSVNNHKSAEVQEKERETFRKDLGMTRHARLTARLAPCTTRAAELSSTRSCGPLIPACTSAVASACTSSPFPVRVSSTAAASQISASLHVPPHARFHTPRPRRRRNQAVHAAAAALLLLAAEHFG